MLASRDLGYRAFFGAIPMIIWHGAQSQMADVYMHALFSHFTSGDTP